MSIEAVKNLAAIQVLNTSANWGFFCANFDDSFREGGQLFGAQRPLGCPRMAAQCQGCISAKCRAWQGA